MSASAVRVHARNVRSIAKRTRRSRSGTARGASLVITYAPDKNAAASVTPAGLHHAHRGSGTHGSVSSPTISESRCPQRGHSV